VLSARKGQELLRQSLAALGRVPDGQELSLQPVVARVSSDQQVSVPEDYGKKIIEVVRDAPGELADGFHLFRLYQVADHLVDVVLKGCDLAGRFHCDRSRKIAFTYSIGHLGDRSHLGRQVGGKLIDIVDYLAPQAGGTGDLSLAAELSFSADFTGNFGDLGGKSVKRLDHAVNSLD
jgi:hypothetical protein